MFLYSGALSTPSALTRSTIYDNFINVQYGVGAGAPGYVFPHDARVAPPRGTPQNILVAGDGAQMAYLFVPTTAANGTLSYSLAFANTYNSTVGDMLVADIDGNGRNDVLIALYDASQIQVYSY